MDCDCILFKTGREIKPSAKQGTLKAAIALLMIR
jgi:hypothetical protein